MHIVFLLHQSSDSSSHGDDVIIRVGGEYDHTLGVGLSPLWTGGVVNIRLTAWPSSDGVLQLVEYFDVHQTGLSVELFYEMSQSVVHIILGR